MRTWRAGVVWRLQSLLVTLVLVLLWQPAITVAELKSQQNMIAVLVDDSRSMAIADSGRRWEDDAGGCGGEGLGNERNWHAGGAAEEVPDAGVSAGWRDRSASRRWTDAAGRLAAATHINDGLKQLAAETATCRWARWCC